MILIKFTNGAPKITIEFSRQGPAYLIRKNSRRICGFFDVCPGWQITPLHVHNGCYRGGHRSDSK